MRGNEKGSVRGWRKGGSFEEDRNRGEGIYID